MDRPYNVLVVCTGNAARSIMAEALINALGHGRFKAYSAAHQPLGQVHPLALELAATTGWPTDGLRSKSWDEFSGPDAPHMDLVLTVCDDAAGEPTPQWPGHPATAHWHVHDPMRDGGSDAQRRESFDRVFRDIMNRVRLLVNLPTHMLDKLALQEAARELSRP